jgi:hypothetical protein
VVEKVCFALLRDSPAVKAFANDRIFRGFMPEWVRNFPVVVFNRESTIERTTHLGGTAGLVLAQIRISIIGPDYDKVMECSDQAIIPLLEVYRGTLEGVTVQGARINGPADDLEQVIAGGEARMHVRIFDWLVRYEEAALPLKDK